jgi:glycosyltransferase involved in cell wall biosynthesis
MKRKRTLLPSLIYVNFSPYENAGRILDYLLQNCRLLVVFSFNFHQLNKRTSSNYLQVYVEGKKVEELKLFRLPTPEALLFITLPLIAGLIALQTIWQLFQLKKKYGQFTHYLTINAFTAWVGILLRKLKIVQYTIFWVWDYYPPGYPDWRIRLARWAYWRVDKLSTLHADKTVFLNKRLVELRQQINVLPPEKIHRVVPIGTNPGKLRIKKKFILGHLGVLKKSQGLDLLFDNLAVLQKKLPQLKVEIIGSGPDEEYFKERAKHFKKVKFYGFIKEEDTVDSLMRNWGVGLATYIPDSSNAAYWTDPSKIKAYISQAVPVVTTAITPFSAEIKKAKAGIVVDYYDAEKFVQAIISALQKPTALQKNAYQLAKKYDYRKIYQDLFLLN